MCDIWVGGGLPKNDTCTPRSPKKYTHIFEYTPAKGLHGFFVLWLLLVAQTVHPEVFGLLGSLGSMGSVGC